jgi:hypothetical protein
MANTYFHKKTIMDKEQIIEIFKEALPTLIEEMLLPEVRKENGKFAASLTKDVSKKLERVSQPEAQRSEDPEKEESKLTLKILEQRIADLTAQLQEKDRKTMEAQRKAAISEAIAGSKAINKPVLQKLFSVEFEDSIQQENNRWIYKSEDGQAQFLDDLLNSYLESEDGKLFIPASSVSGSGSTESKSTIVNPNKELTTEQRYEAMQRQVFG